MPKQVYMNNFLQNNIVTQNNSGTFNNCIINQTVNIAGIDEATLRAVLAEMILKAQAESLAPLPERTLTHYENTFISNARELKSIPDGGRFSAKYL